MCDDNKTKLYLNILTPKASSSSLRECFTIADCSQPTLTPLCGGEIEFPLAVKESRLFSGLYGRTEGKRLRQIITLMGKILTFFYLKKKI